MEVTPMSSVPEHAETVDMCLTLEDYEGVIDGVNVQWSKNAAKYLNQEFRFDMKPFIKSFCEAAAVRAASRLGDLNLDIMYSNPFNIALGSLG